VSPALPRARPRNGNRFKHLDGLAAALAGELTHECFASRAARAPPARCGFSLIGLQVAASTAGGRFHPAVALPQLFERIGCRPRIPLAQGREHLVVGPGVEP
jgi:hypothetical protein